MENEGLLGAHLDELGEVGLLLGGIDMRVAMVLEDPEVAIKAHVDTGWLDHARVVGLQRHSPSLDLSTQVSVG